MKDQELTGKNDSSESVIIRSRRYAYDSGRFIGEQHKAVAQEAYGAGFAAAQAASNESFTARVKRRTDLENAGDESPRASNKSGEPPEQ